MGRLGCLLLLGIIASCPKNGKVWAGEPPSGEVDTKSTTTTLAAPLNSDPEKTDHSSEDHDESASQSENEEAATDSKNVTEIPEKTNVTEETIENIVLPEKGSAEKEHSSSLAIAFLLFTLILTIFMIHAMLQIKFHYLPESLAIVFLGAVLGLLMTALPEAETKRVEAFSPTMFFLILLPPIIFESGYNLNKGNFFSEHWKHPCIRHPGHRYIGSCGWWWDLSTRPCRRCLPSHIRPELCFWLAH